MSRLLVRSSVRHLGQHPWQLLLSLLGVALGVAVVLAIELAVQSSREGFRLSTEAVAGRATHQVTGGLSGLPDDLLARIRIELGLRESAPVVEGYAALTGLPGRSLRLLGIDPFSELPFRPVLAAGPVEGGVDVSSLVATPGAVLLAESAARSAGLAPGERLELLVQGVRRNALLAGTLDPVDDLGRRGIQDLVVADVATAQEMLGRVGRIDRIDLIVPEGAEGDALIEGIRAMAPPDAVVEGVGARARDMADMIRAFDLNLTALSLLALVFGMFLIYNTMTFSVVQRRPLIGTVRSLGVTPRGVFLLVLGEAVALGLVGTGLGLGLGVLLGRGLVDLVTRTINDLYFVVAVDALAIPPGTVLKAALMGVAATALSAVPAAREATKAPPRVVLGRSFVEARARDAVPRTALYGVGLLGLGCGLLLLPSRSPVLGLSSLGGIILGLALLTPLATVGFVAAVRPVLGRTVGILGTLASRGVVTALSRTAPAIVALVVAVSVTVGLGIMISSFRETVVRWLDTTLQADVYVSLPSPVSSRAEGLLDPTLVEGVERLPGVAGVSTYRGAEVRTGFGPVRLAAIRLDPRGEAAFRFKEGNGAEALVAFRSGGALLVSESFAYRHTLAPGDSVPVETPRGTRPFPVAGVFYDYGAERGVVMMGRTTFDSFWDDPAVTSLGVFVEEGASPDELMDAIRATAGPERPVIARSNRALRELSLAVFDRTFTITVALRLLAAIVAFIAVLSALMALQLERGRELAVLRVNGLTPGQVWHLVTAQTGLMGFVAGVIAMPVGVVLATVMIHVVNRRSFGWTIEMEVGPGLLGSALILALSGALLAGVYPAWRMSRTRPARALRSE